MLKEYPEVSKQLPLVLVGHVFDQLCHELSCAVLCSYGIFL